MNSRNARSGALLLALAVLLALVAGLRPVGLDRDSLAYAAVLAQPFADIASVVNEPAYQLIMYLNGILFGAEARTFFLAFALLGVGAKVYAIHKVAAFPLLSLCVYVLLYFVLHEMTQIRVGVAAAIFLCAIPDIEGRHRQAYLLKTLLAMTFHYSAILMLPVYLLRSGMLNRVVYLALPLVGIALALLTSYTLPLFSGVVGWLPEAIGYRLNIYLILLSENEQATINVFNPFYVTLTMLYIFLVINQQLLRGLYDTICLKVLGISLFLYFSMSFLPVMSFRMAEFYGVVLIVLVPNALYLFRDRIVPALLLGGWLGVYFVAVIPTVLSAG